MGTKRILSLGAAVAAALAFGITAPASASVHTTLHSQTSVSTSVLAGTGGGSGGSSGGGRSVSGGSSGSGSGRSVSSGSSGSGSGRNVTPPKNSGGNSGSSGSSGSGRSVSSGSSGSSGRNVTPPQNSGGKSQPLTSRSVTVNPPTSRVDVPSSARARGSSYSYGGHTWSYSRDSYHVVYVQYNHGYPAYGTPEFWTLIGSPWYGPNYANPASPWYHHSVPVGYHMANGEIVEDESNFWAWFWGILLVVALAIAVGWFLSRRPRAYGRGI